VDVIVDSSVWIDVLAGERIAAIINAMTNGTLVLTPIVIAELLSGDLSASHRTLIGELLQDFVLHPSDLGHWMRVGELRRFLASRGVNVTIADAHVAQCALDRGAVLLSRDDIFARIAKHTSLRLQLESAS
jgi:hypothetical protein